MTEPILPFWFIQRQAKATPAGDNVYRLTAPNLDDYHIAIRPADAGRWSAALGKAADGPDLAATEATFRDPRDAWEAAFELYRINVIT